jgi:hypothetical protein
LSRTDDVTCFFPRAASLLALSALLASCASSPQQTAERYEERCASHGLQPNTEAFRTCVTQLENARQQRLDTRHREQIERSANPLR